MSQPHLRYVRNSERQRLAKWRIEENHSEVIFSRTGDGWELALSRYSHQPNRNWPVLLCHGLGSNRLSFDIDAEHSLARHLVQQGYDVYALDLRGHGLSQKPQRGTAQRWGWGFNDYCEQDVPTAIAAILQRTGKSQLHFIGHSMGGLLLYGRTALGEENIRSGIAIGSSLDYSGTPSVFHKIVNLAPAASLLPSIPVHWTALASSWASQFSARAIDPVLVNPPNVRLQTYRKLAANGLHPVSARVLVELAGAINGAGLKTKQGQSYADLLQQRGYHFPILAMAGSADLQCPPSAAARFGTSLQVFGREQGQREDYGHDDLIMGRHASAETWPAIVDWLAQHDAR